MTGSIDLDSEVVISDNTARSFLIHCQNFIVASKSVPKEITGHFLEKKFVKSYALKIGNVKMKHPVH